jgi:hypothetical protein
MTDKIVCLFVRRMLDENYTSFTIGNFAQRYKLDFCTAQFILAEGQKLGLIRPDRITGTFFVSKDYGATERLAAMNLVEEYKVGDSVSVVRDGQVYSGRVKESNGKKHKLDFGNKKPHGTKGDEEYEESEMAKNEDITYSPDVDVVYAEIKKEKESDFYVVKIGDKDVPVQVRQQAQDTEMWAALQAVGLFDKLFGIEFQWRYCNEEAEWYLEIYVTGTGLDNTALGKTAFSVVKSETDESAIKCPKCGKTLEGDKCECGYERITTVAGKTRHVKSDPGYWNRHKSEFGHHDTRLGRAPVTADESINQAVNKLLKE